MTLLRRRRPARLAGARSQRCSPRSTRHPRASRSSSSSTPGPRDDGAALARAAGAEVVELPRQPGLRRRQQRRRRAGAARRHGPAQPRRRAARRRARAARRGRPRVRRAARPAAAQRRRHRPGLRPPAAGHRRRARAALVHPPLLPGELRCAPSPSAPSGRGASAGRSPPRSPPGPTMLRAARPVRPGGVPLLRGHGAVPARARRRRADRARPDVRSATSAATRRGAATPRAHEAARGAARSSPRNARRAGARRSTTSPRRSRSPARRVQAPRPWAAARAAGAPKLADAAVRSRAGTNDVRHCPGSRLGRLRESRAVPPDHADLETVHACGARSARWRASCARTTAPTADHSHRWRRCPRVADHMGLDALAATEVELVAVLHDVGKLADRPACSTIRGRSTTSSATAAPPHDRGRGDPRPGSGLEHLGVLVRATHESWDGNGYPDGATSEHRTSRSSRAIARCAALPTREATAPRYLADAGRQSARPRAPARSRSTARQSDGSRLEQAQLDSAGSASRRLGSATSSGSSTTGSGSGSAAGCRAAGLARAAAGRRAKSSRRVSSIERV